MRKKRGPAPVKLWTVLEVAYIAKYYEHDGAESLAAAFDISKGAIDRLIWILRRNGELEQYRTIWQEHVNRRF
jgi:hypothetical protein